MIYSKKQVGIALGDIKNACLYFDFVIPVYIPEGFSRDFEPPSAHRREGKKVTSRREYKFPREKSLHRDIYRQLGKKRLRRLDKELPSFESFENKEKAIPYLIYAISNLARDLKRGGYLPVPVLDGEPLPELAWTGFEAISIISSNVAVINTDKVDWDHLKEFKEDKESVRSLRNYRLFWASNYSNMSVDFIEDDLERRYEKFISSCKKHGFEIVHKTVGNLLQSKSLLATAGLALASAFLGEPIRIESILGAGISLEIGKISLDISEIKLKHKELLKHNELLYLYRITKKFGKQI